VARDVDGGVQEKSVQCFRVRASEDILLDGRGHRVTAYERVE